NRPTACPCLEVQDLQRVAFMKDQETKQQFALARIHRDLVENSRLIQIQRARREAATAELQLRSQDFTQGGMTTIDVLSEAYRNWADACRDECTAIAAYNLSLAESQRGATCGAHQATCQSDEPCLVPAFPPPRPDGEYAMDGKFTPCPVPVCPGPVGALVG